MQPGMPQGFGVVGRARTPLFTLPGNPVSAFVSFHLFVRPAMAALPGPGSGTAAALRRAALTASVYLTRAPAVLPARRARPRGGHGHPAVPARAPISSARWPGPTR